MTENRRIFLNIIVTYARSLFGLACGLLTGRWVLLSLGEIDYGLFGVVACMMTFVAFLNGIFIGGCTRFYAISIGQARVSDDKALALEECRRWFNTALTIETSFPVLLFLVGYPVGEWAVRSFLTIPPDRVSDCLWVFRLVCLSNFVGMVCCPFDAMYTAKQYIAELTVYSFVTSILNVAFGGYMITHPGSWLRSYAAWTCLLSIAPSVVIAIRAVKIFPECKINFHYMWDWNRLKTVLGFSGCIVFGGLSTLLRFQGMTVLINKFYGPRANASMAVANSVNAHTSTLSGALQGAFTPAITTAYGAGDYEKANALALRGCKFSMILALLFSLPLSLEIHEVLRLWLASPPACAAGLCVCMMALNIAESSTTGHMIAVNANGRIFWYNVILSLIGYLTLPLAAILAWCGFSLYWMAYTLLVFICINSVGRVLFARHYVGMSVNYWLFRVVMPISLIVCMSAAIGLLPRLFMGASFVRVILTTIFTEVAFVPLIWAFSFDRDEKEFVLSKISKIFGRRMRPDFSEHC